MIVQDIKSKIPDTQDTITKFDLVNVPTTKRTTNVRY